VDAHAEPKERYSDEDDVEDGEETAADSQEAIAPPRGDA
jgi:hypothetical protein